MSPTSQTSHVSSNGQPSLVSTTSILTPPPPITRQRPVNLRQNPKQRVPYNPFANHATVLPTTITEPTSFTIAKNSPEWRQAMKEEYDALVKNGMWSLVTRASNTNVVDCKWVYRLKRDKNGAITTYKARSIIKEVLFWYCNPVSSPMVTSISLSLDDSTAFSNPVKYQQVVASLQYVTLSWLSVWHSFCLLTRYAHTSFFWFLPFQKLSSDVLWKGNPDTSLEAFWVGDSDYRREVCGLGKINMLKLLKILTSLGNVTALHVAAQKKQENLLFSSATGMWRPSSKLFRDDSSICNFLIGRLNRGIAPVAIIDRQLPFEYTIASRSTDVMVMAHPAQNINHSAFRSMFEREKLSGNNFNDWFRQLKLVLRVEKKMYVIEQPIPPAPAADSAANVLAEWNAVYDAHNEVACLMLGSMTPELHRQFENYSPYEMFQELKSMFEKQAGVERFDLIQTFHACKLEDGKPVGAYVLKMKDYVEQLKRLGYVLPQDLSVGLILNGLTSDFAGFVRNYNMHNMGKTIGELYALLIEYEKGLPKKAAIPQVMTIQGGRIQKANKKSQKANHICQNVLHLCQS
ncbi:retrotransposon protein, putative, ty1-copia subclass [Tanacetum coccineum]